MAGMDVIESSMQRAMSGMEFFLRNFSYVPHRSSVEIAPPVPRDPTHAPESHFRSPIVALAGVGRAMSSGWR